MVQNPGLHRSQTQGLLIVPWSVFNAIVVSKRQKTNQKPSRMYFYFLAVDSVFSACFAVSIAYGRTSLPVNLVDCDDLPPDPTRLFAQVGRALGRDSAGGCLTVLSTQIMTIVLL